VEGTGPTDFIQGFPSWLELKEGQLRIRSEWDNPEEPDFQSDTHCFIRPFSKFVQTGKLPQGDLQLGSFSTSNLTPFALYAMSISGEKDRGNQRITLFLPFVESGIRRLDAVKQIQGEPAELDGPAPIDHITCELPSGKVKVHQSLKTTSGPKARVFPEQTRVWQSGQWMDLGTMSIRSPLVLDPAWNVASSDNFLSTAHRQSLSALNAYLLPGHPVHFLRTQWNRGWHLRVGFYAARTDKQGRILALPPVHWMDHLAFGIYPNAVNGLWSPDERSQYADKPISAHWDAYAGNEILVLVTYGLFPGIPISSFSWMGPIGQLDPNFWDRQRFWDHRRCIFQ
jgi:hypothetical protein